MFYGLLTKYKVVLGQFLIRLVITYIFKYITVVTLTELRIAFKPIMPNTRI